MGAAAARLRLVIAGHVDHGKSTLIGRLLLDTASLPAAKLDEIRRASAAAGHDVELAYAMDHLEEERVGLMTIDTAQVRFAAGGREYAVIDAPGHREFMRNMLTGASQADAAVFVVDAAEGVREQSRRHAFVLAMLGIRQVVVLVNKMDLVGFGRERFEAVRAELESFFRELGISPAEWIPGSARMGENIVTRGRGTAWYAGPTVLDALGAIQPPRRHVEFPLRLPVQDGYEVGGRRILVGRVEAGRLHTGQEIVFFPSGRKARVASVEVFMQSRDAAEAGESIGMTVEALGSAGSAGAACIDRGEVACEPSAPAPVCRSFVASLFWLGERPGGTGEPMVLRLATQELPCRVELRRVLDSSTLEGIARAPAEIRAAEAAEAVIHTEDPVVVERFADLPPLGRFVLCLGGEVVAGGIVREVL